MLSNTKQDVSQWFHSYKNTFKVAPGLLDFRDNTDAIGLTKFTILDKYNHSKRSHQKSLNKQNLYA